jgi:hypothetical protein
MLHLTQRRLEVPRTHHDVNRRFCHDLVLPPCKYVGILEDVLVTYRSGISLSRSSRVHQSCLRSDIANGGAGPAALEMFLSAAPLFWREDANTGGILRYGIDTGIPIVYRFVAFFRFRDF